MTEKERQIKTAAAQTDSECAVVSTQSSAPAATSLKCPTCGGETICLGGRSAHAANWYCSNARCGWTAWEQNTKYDRDNRHRHCPDENGVCYFSDDPNCTVLNSERYTQLADHWENWTGKTWQPPIRPKLTAAVDAAIAAAQDDVATERPEIDSAPAPAAAIDPDSPLYRSLQPLLPLNHFLPYLQQLSLFLAMVQRHEMNWLKE